MKKILLFIAAGMFAMVSTNAQITLYNTGPIFDLAGGGSGGANASTLHDGLTTYGAGHQVSNGNRVADDFIVPAGATWMIDSIVVFAYQTGSGILSTISAVNLQIWDGPPGAPSNVVFGDDITNIMISSEWSGTYRTGDFTSTTCPPATCIDRPIMRNALAIGTTLQAGTYWADWQTDGFGTSGPWAPPINLGAGITATGNAKQYTTTSMAWNDLLDGSGLGATGLPLIVIGSGAVGIDEFSASSQVSVYPNPMVDQATVSMNFPISASDKFTFTVFDALGNVVQQMHNINKQTFTFNRINLNSGVYFYRLSNENKIVRNGKIVLQ